MSSCCLQIYCYEKDECIPPGFCSYWRDDAHSDWLAGHTNFVSRLMRNRSISAYDFVWGQAYSPADWKREYNISEFDMLKAEQDLNRSSVDYGKLAVFWLNKQALLTRVWLQKNSLSLESWQDAKQAPDWMKKFTFFIADWLSRNNRSASDLTKWLQSGAMSVDAWVVDLLFPHRSDKLQCPVGQVRFLVFLHLHILSWKLTAFKVH